MREKLELLNVAIIARSTSRLHVAHLFCVQATIVDDVLECVIHQAAAAAHVLLSVAVNQLLLTECNQLPRVDLVDAFNSAHCRVRPARSAEELIFDVCNGPLFPPINCLCRLHILVAEVGVVRRPGVTEELPDSLSSFILFKR